ncbi:MAG: hypothetical protein M3T56_17220 [Chloroflexota bacterium]|nr:hypothetical protein [Chloroflexota bacterium]
MIGTEPDERLVFTPELGFRSAQILESPTNLVIERDGLTLTANLVCDRDCTTLHFTVLGFDAPADFDSTPYYHVKASATVRDDRGRPVEPHPRWHTGGMVHRRGDGTLIFDWQLKLVRLEPDVRSVELSFGGPAGEWTVKIPIAMVEVAGAPASRISVSDEHQGVAVRATAVARPSQFTAIEIEADIVDEPGVEPKSRVRYVQGIGAHHHGRLVDELFMLRDDQGHQHPERPSVSTPGPRNRQVVSFPALPDDVRSGVVEIPFVVVQQRTDETLSVPVPGDTDVRFLGCDATVSTSHTSGDEGVQVREGGPDYRGPRVRVEIRPKDPDAPKQLLYFSLPGVDGAPDIGGWMSKRVGKPAMFEAPDPSGAATAVKLRGPVVKLLGPWKLEIPL